MKHVYVNDIDNSCSDPRMCQVLSIDMTNNVLYDSIFLLLGFSNMKNDCASPVQQILLTYCMYPSDLRIKTLLARACH